MTVRNLMLAAALALTAMLPLKSVAQTPDAPGASDASSPSVVTAVATARVFRKPDYMDVVVGVETQAESATGAYTDCAKKMDAVIRAIKALNLSGVELQTGTVDLSPKYNDREAYDQSKPRKIIGYAAVNTVRVRTTDLKAGPRVIDTALAEGANRIDGVMFNVKEVLDAREEALRLAVKAAKRKATVMAEALDSGLGRVLSSTESTRHVFPWQSNRWSANSMMVQTSVGGGGESAGSDSIEPGMIEIVVDVTLTYALR